ncbi:hypothetical protein COOONC_23733 [Cooperia oncophora]
MDVDMDAAGAESESGSVDEEEGVDPETLNRLENALGKAAGLLKEEKRELRSMKKSQTPPTLMTLKCSQWMIGLQRHSKRWYRGKAKQASQLASAFRLKLADLLLFTVSSQDTPPSIKVHMIIPLLKLAKLQLKQDAEGLNSRKTISLLNIVSRLKKM